ncbi:hypothetical protein PRIC1_001090 [Phytophthora ramorum]
MKFSNKDLYCLLFSELSPGKWKCNSCKKVYKEGRGYTNQVHFLLRMHPDYPQLAEAVFRKGIHLGLSLPDQRTSKVFRWIEWYVVERMPVSFCDLQERQDGSDCCNYAEEVHQPALRTRP